MLASQRSAPSSPQTSAAKPVAGGKDSRVAAAPTGAQLAPETGRPSDAARRRALIGRCCGDPAGCADGDPPPQAARQARLSEALRRAVEARAGADRADEMRAHAAPPADATRNPEPAGEELYEEEDVTRNTCSVAAGPAYTPTGNVPVVVSGGRKSAPFSFSAAFEKSSASWWQFWRSDRVPDCCEVRQYIKWDQAYVDSKGGPPHGGFPATAQPGVWYEDRDANDKRYGHRSGAHSDPIAGGGDEYTTNGVRDQAHGDRYDGRDAPGAPESRSGQFQFKLAVIDTCNSNTVKARSSVITVNW